MRITYLLSYPVLFAGETGGVLRLFRSYMEMARVLGHSVALYSPFEQLDLSSADLVHIAPGDLSMLSTAQVLKYKGVPFVVSPILDKTYPNYALRMVAVGDRLLGRLYHSHFGAAREICKLSAGVCLMSSHEGERITRGLGIRPKILRVVQPAISCDLAAIDPGRFQELYGPGEFILFVGDLGNPRKNVLRLIQAASMSNLPLVLIGPLNNTRYGQHVRHAVQQTQIVRYMGVVPQDILFSAMKQCRVFALPSLMEGIGMAAIEAGALDARVVITKYGGPPDYFGNLVWYVDPYSVRSIANGLVAAWNANETPQLAQHLKESLSVAALAPKLDALYRDALRGVNIPDSA